MNFLARLLKGAIIGAALFVALMYITSLLPVAGLVGLVGLAGYGVYRGVQAVNLAALKAQRYLGRDVEVPQSRPRLRDYLRLRTQERLQKTADLLLKPREEPAPQKKSSSLVYSRETGWNVDNLPGDLSPRLVSNKDRRAVFSCYGRENAVVAEADRKGNVIYSFKVPAYEKDLRDSLSEMVKNHPGTSIRQDKDGDYVVSSVTPEGILPLAKAAISVESMSSGPEVPVIAMAEPVEKEFTTIEQVLYSGCASLEEAKQKARSGEPGQVVNKYYSTKVRVDGKENVYTEGAPVGVPEHLPADSFMLERRVTTVYKGTLNIPSDQWSTPGTLTSYVMTNYVPRYDDRVSVPLEVLKDGAPDALRFIEDMDGKRLFLRKADEKGFRESGLTANIVFDSYSSYMATLQNGKLTEGTQVIFRKGALQPSGDGFVLTMGVDAELLSKVSVRETISDELRHKCDRLMMSTSDVKLSGISTAVERDGSFAVDLKDALNVGLDKLDSQNSLVNGVAAREFHDRMSNPRLETLSQEEARQWAKDASRIQSVTVTVDAKMKTMTVTSVIDGVASTPQTRPLSDDELKAFARRGDISVAEKKDLLLQSYPQLFESYRFGNGRRYMDPVGDYLKGNSPAYTPAYASHMAKKAGLTKNNSLSAAAKPKCGYGGIPM